MRSRWTVIAKALAAIATGEFVDEITPYTLADHYPDLEQARHHRRHRIIKNDEGPRAGTTLDVLAKLKTVFRRSAAA